MWGKRCCVASAKPPSPPPLPQGKEEIAAAAAFASGRESLFQPVYFASQVASPNLGGGGKDIADSLQPPPPPPLLHLTQQQPTHRHRSGWRGNEPAMKEGGIRQVFPIKNLISHFFIFLQKC